MKLDHRTLSFITQTCRDILGDLDRLRIFLFGSYAQGTAHNRSDIDVALDIGQPISLGTMNLLKEAFEESSLTQKVDVVDFCSMTNEFQNKILENSITL